MKILPSRPDIFFSFAAILLAAIFFAPGSAGAEENVLPLKTFIETTVKTNPKYEISAKEYLLALYSDRSARSIDDWNLIAGATYLDSRPSPASGFAPNSLGSLGYNVGIEKYVVQTGTAFKLEHSAARTTADYPPFTMPGTTDSFSLFPPSPYYTADLSLTITQPLLKNGFGLIAKKSLDMSGYSLKLAEIKLAEDWEDFIASLVSEYLYWQKCRLNVDVFADKLGKAEQQLALIERQKRYGLSEDLDVVQIKQMVQGYKIMLERAKTECEAQTRRILSIMGSRKARAENIGPEKLALSEVRYGKDEALEYLLEGSNIKKATDLLVSVNEAALDIKKNEELPDASLILSATPNSMAMSSDKSISEIGEYDSYMAGLTVSMPLFGGMASAEKMKAEEELARAIKEKEKILLDSSVGLEALYINLASLDGMIKLGRENAALAAERLRLEKAKYEQGRNSLFFVLQAESALLEAESALNETLFARESVVNQIKSFTDAYMAEYKEILTINN